MSPPFCDKGTSLSWQRSATDRPSTCKAYKHIKSLFVSAAFTFTLGRPVANWQIGALALGILLPDWFNSGC